MILREELHRIKSIMGIIKESSEEEAWELLGQDDPVIKNLVTNNGYTYDEESVKKLIPIIDALPAVSFNYGQIQHFLNLENKSGDIGLMKKMHEISNSEDPREGYKEYMMKRDESEGRDRGYDPVVNFDNIVDGNYEPPLVLLNDNGNEDKRDDKYHVIGGRTRLYASIAANTPIKVKVLHPSDLPSIN